MNQKIIIHMEEKNLEKIKEEININMTNIQIKISKNIIIKNIQIIIIKKIIS